MCKKSEATILFVNFSKSFDSIHRGKMEQILLAYGLLKETVAAIMMLCKNTKVKVRSPDGDTDYFEIVAGVLQGDTLAPYLFIICLDFVLRISIDKMKDNDLKLAKERSRRYSTQTITDIDYTDDIALLANTPAQAKTLLHSLERAAGGIGLHVSADKTEYMCFNQRGDIFTLNGSSLKLMDKFTYLGSSLINWMLQTILNKSWMQHLTKQQLYGHLPPITKVRWIRHAGHCWRSKDELVSDILLWTLSHGRVKAGQSARTYIQQFCADTGCSLEDLLVVMDNRDGWQERVREICACSVTQWWWWNFICFFFSCELYLRVK